jgi:hypothetical protein
MRNYNKNGVVVKDTCFYSYKTEKYEKVLVVWLEA